LASASFQYDSIQWSRVAVRKIGAELPGGVRSMTAASAPSWFHSNGAAE
jgi:hypothetical protein